MKHLQYPIGRFHAPESYSDSLLHGWITDLENFPLVLQKALATLRPRQLDLPYRPGGWTRRQVVHHLCDSHMNGFLRHKHTLASEDPVILPYPEALFSEMADSKNFPVEPALLLLQGLHAKWAALVKNLPANAWLRTYRHPQYNRQYTLRESLGNYVWHGKHHIAHLLLP
jgi:hypothetical protein